MKDKLLSKKPSSHSIDTLARHLYNKYRISLSYLHCQNGLHLPYALEILLLLHLNFVNATYADNHI